MKNKRPVLIWVLFVLLLIAGIGAIISGAMMFLSPDGDMIKMSVDMLEHSPFSNFLIPGIVLFLFVGVFPLMVVYGLTKKPDWKWPNTLNPSKNYHWAWAATWATGLIMLIWIGVETLMVGYVSFLQPLIAVWGFIIIVLSLIPRVKTYLTLDR